MCLSTCLRAHLGMFASSMCSLFWNMNTIARFSLTPTTTSLHYSSNRAKALYKIKFSSLLYDTKPNIGIRTIVYKSILFVRAGFEFRSCSLRSLYHKYSWEKVMNPSLLLPTHTAGCGSNVKTDCSTTLVGN